MVGKGRATAATAATARARATTATTATTTNWMLLLIEAFVGKRSHRSHPSHCNRIDPFFFLHMSNTDVFEYLSRARKKMPYGAVKNYYCYYYEWEKSRGYLYI